MEAPTWRRAKTSTNVGSAAITLVASFLVASLAHADEVVRSTTSGRAFSLARGSHAIVDDVGGGRRFRGKGFSTVTLTGELSVPPAASSNPKMLRLVLHFHTSPPGPTLRSVDVSGGIHVQTDLTGNMEGESKLNSWDFATNPVNLGAKPSVHLTVGFPGGIDSKVDSGGFVITSVSVDYVRKLPALRP